MAIYWCEKCQSYRNFVWNGTIPVCENCKEKEDKKENK